MNTEIKIGNLLRLYKLLMERIASIIGLETPFNLAVDMDYIKYSWKIVDSTLIITNNDDEEYKYKIASYSKPDKKFFLGTEGDLMFVMVEDENNIFIIVLDKDLGI